MTTRDPGRANDHAAAGDAWMRLDECLDRAPASLHPWLAEPGLLTARVRRACGSATQFRLLRLDRASLQPMLASRMDVQDKGCLLREIEFACGAARWIFAQSVFPDSTLAAHPWLADLGNAALGESLLGRHDVSREPLEYRELAATDALAAAAGGLGGCTWARRAVYQLSGAPILVQEVFLPALIDNGRDATRPGSSP
jgi:chorismate--pyruvate lyase